MNIIEPVEVASSVISMRYNSFRQSGPVCAESVNALDSGGSRKLTGLRVR